MKHRLLSIQSTSPYKIFISTTSKFLHGFFDGESNVQIYKKDFENNPLLIIDEIDRQKNVFLDFFLENHYLKSSNIIDVFKEIKDYLSTDGKFIDLYINQKNNDSIGCEIMMKELTKLKDKINEIENKFYLTQVYKFDMDLFNIDLKEEIQEKYNCIFHDNTIGEILSSETDNYNKYTIKQDVNQIILNLTDNETEQENLFEIHELINKIISIFTKEFPFFVEKYIIKQFKKNESVNVFQKTNEYILNNLQEISTKTELKNIILRHIEKRRNNVNFYALGDSFYNRDNFIYYLKQNIDTQNLRINTSILNITPEALLENLCQKFMVIGASATADTDSNICNFDLNYIEKMLGDKFYKLSLNEKNKFKNLYHKHLSCDKIKIEVKNIFNTFNTNIYKTVDEANIYKNELEKIFESIKKTHGNDKPHIKNRIYSICNLIYDVLNNNNNTKTTLVFLNGFNEITYYKSLIRFINKIYSKNKDKEIKAVYVDKSNIKELIHVMSNEKIEDEREEVEYNEFIDDKSKSKSNQIKDFTEHIKNNGIGFVFTSYSSASAGVNFKYKFNFNENIIINNSKEENMKDFDNVYLENKTHLISEEKEQNYFYKCMALCENGTFTKKQAINILKNFYKETKSKRYTQKTTLRQDYLNTMDANYFRLKEIKQTVGRLNRVKNHYQYRTIYFDNEFIQKINNQAILNLKGKNNIETKEMELFLNSDFTDCLTENNEKINRLNNYNSDSSKLFRNLTLTLKDNLYQQQKYFNLKRIIIENPIVENLYFSEHKELVNVYVETLNKTYSFNRNTSNDCDYISVLKYSDDLELNYKVDFALMDKIKNMGW